MMPLDFPTIQARLDERFTKYEQRLTGTKLRASRLAELDINRCERRLGLAFPREFRQVLLQFDFGSLTFGPTSFCNTGDYLGQLLIWNKAEEESLCQWWGEGERPVDKLLVATGDPYSIILNVFTGEVFAIKGGEDTPSNAKLVGCDFEGFLRGLATVIVERLPGGNNMPLALAVADSIGASEKSRFWLHMAE